jgi:RHS repeat-associated protein
LSAEGEGIGGFTLSPHDFYDPTGRVLYRGNGTRRSDANVNGVVTTIAGVGTAGSAEAEITALQAHFRMSNNTTSTAVGPDGSVYVPDTDNHSVRRLWPDGHVSRFAGTGSSGSSGDGGFAAQAQLSLPTGVSIASDGSVLIADWGNARIRRVSPAGIISTAVGGSRAASAEGDTGTAVHFYSPSGIAAGPDGSIYVVDRLVNQVFKVDPSGRTWTFAGQQTGGVSLPASGNEGPAKLAVFGQLTAVAVSPSGEVYVTDAGQCTVQRISVDGVLHAFAGKRQTTAFVAGDGGRATDAHLWCTPSAIAFAPNGTAYITGGNQFVIRKVDPTGTISLYAGSYAGSITPALGRDNVAAAAANIYLPWAPSVGPDGSVFFLEEGTQRVRRIAPPLPGLTSSEIAVASEDGTALEVFDAAGRHLRTVSTASRDTILAFAYDGEGRLSSVRDHDGRITTLERATSGLVSAVIAPNGERTEIGMNAQGDLQSATNPANERLVFTYGTGGLLLGTSDPSGASLAAYVYNVDGTLAARTNALGGTTTYTHSGTSETAQVSVKGPGEWDESIVYEHLPTGAHRVQTIVVGGGTGTIVADATGTITRTDPDGTTTTTRKYPDPQFGMQSPMLEEVVRTPAGLTRTLRDRRGATLNDPNDPLSDLVHVDSVIVNGRVTTATYDELSNTISGVSAAGRRTSSSLDSQGRLTTSSVPGREPISIAYDELGRVTTIGAGTRLLHNEYDSQDRVTSVTDALGRIERFGYDNADRRTSHTFADGRRVSYRYDTRGNLVAVTPPSRPAHALASNVAGQPLSYQAPSAPARTFEYDSAGRIVLTTREDGSTIREEYAHSGLVWTGIASTGDTITATTDSTSNRVVRATRSSGANLTFAYDGFLLSRISWAGLVNGTVNLAYDSDFRLQAEAVNGNAGITYDYDKDGYLTRAGSLAIDLEPQTGSEQQLRLDASVTSVRYDGFGMADSIATAVNGSVVHEVLLYRDSIGRISNRVETVNGVRESSAFTYDVSGQLLSTVRNGILTAQYEYDASGNRTRVSTTSGSVVVVSDSADRLISYGGKRFFYRSTGELDRSILGTDTTVYRFGAFGELLSVIRPQRDTVTYVVDAVGRRVGRRVNGVLAQAFLYRNNSEIVAEMNGAGQIVSRFVYGRKRHLPEYMIRSGQSFRFILDERGSVRLVVNAATEEIAQRIDYDGFGNVTANTNPGFQPFGYAGGLLDDLTGLTHFGARDYDPTVGRWISTDPMLFDAGDANLYRYAGNDPINAVDPTGFIIEQLNLAQEDIQILEDGEAKLVESERKQFRERLCSAASRVVMPYKELEKLTKGTRFNAHHIYQAAEMAEEIAGYSYRNAQAVLLLSYLIGGGKKTAGMPHQLGSLIQQESRLAGDPLDAVARKTLSAAGCNPESIDRIMEAAGPPRP